MQLKVRCPACQKGIRVAEGDAGGVALCPACGHRFEVAPAPLLKPLAMPPPLPVIATDSIPAAVTAAVANPGPMVPVLADDNEELVPIQLERDYLAAGAPPAPVDVPMRLLPEGTSVAPPAPPPIPVAPPPLLGPADVHTSATPDPNADTKLGLVVPPPFSPAPEPLNREGAMDLIPPALPRIPMTAVVSAHNPPAFANDVTTVDPPPVMPTTPRLESDTAPASSSQRDLFDEEPAPSRAPWWLALGVMTIAVAAVVWILATSGVFDSWEAKHREALLELKARAESAAAAGKWDDATEIYLQITQQIGTRQLDDPALKELAEAARTHPEQYAQLIAREKFKAQQEANRRAALAAMTPAAPRLPPGARMEPPPEVEEPDPPKPPPAPVVKPAPAPAPPPVPVIVARPEPRPAAAPANVLTDEQIGRSIQRGVDWLVAQYDRTETVAAVDRGDKAYFAGLDALVTYAILQGGQALGDAKYGPRTPLMRPKLDALKNLPITGFHETYARGLRATCLALYNRPDDLKQLQDDADYLLGTVNSGAYSYNGVRVPKARRRFGNTEGGWDNSNSQYGVLGVWSALDAEPTVEVPSEYWRAVQKHWTDTQLEDGQWGYSGGAGAGRLTMTAAGVASLFVAHDYLGNTMEATAVGREPYPPALRKALDWFEEGEHATTVPRHWWGYCLYGIERVGLASGYKHFGGRDWYRELAAQIVKEQNRDGSWPSEAMVDTSYAVLFLSRGRHPILMNKLRFDRRNEAGPTQYWNNRPRDLANASRFATRQLERPINWQVVNIDNAWTEWCDSPILYIAGHLPPRLQDSDYDKLRAFVEAGGMIFTHADAGSAPFSAWAADLGKKLFPQYEMQDLPPDHLIYNVLYKPNPKPPLRAVSNGARVLIVHSPTDLAVKWQSRQDRAWEGNKPVGDGSMRSAQLAPFQLAANLFVYVAGKRDLRNRLDSPWITAPDAQPSMNIKLARLRYNGNWDPEPGAWRRYANWFARQTGYKLDVTPVRLADLKLTDAPVAQLTGNGRYDFTANEVAALKTYVESGGVLLLDHTGGAGPFSDDIRTLLTKAFPDRFETVLETDHPLLNDSAPGMEPIGKPRLRPYALEKVGTLAGSVGLLKAGKGHVILTGVDITSGLLGTRTWGILGYQPAHSQALVKNTILWTLDGQPGK